MSPQETYNNRSKLRHSLFTPLTVIKGYVSMLQEGNYGTISKEAENILTIIERSTDKLTAELNNII